MIQKFFNLKISTNGQKLYDFTEKTYDWIRDNCFKNGILNISIQHTSASLIVQENADPDVQTDLINYFDRLVPMNNKLYVHTTEGKDDMPAHIKSSLTNNQISLSIKNGKLEDKAKIKMLPENTHIMLCGNPDMLRDTTITLKEIGLKKHRRSSPGHITTENYW